MKKLFLMGVIFACSLGFGMAANENEAQVTCWESSCGTYNCSIYEDIEELCDDIAFSEIVDCGADIVIIIIT
ncbi:MAG: hypothetical protein LBJ72_08950 [Dysgonamonadaceae bacterium]|jgi:hypothetical protein|nr:hypothetical protein [Dysgonamonadaceae bacterium]